MKKLALLFILFTVLKVSAQKIIKIEKVSDYSTHVTGDKFEGVIFSNKEISGFLFTKGDKKFTPNEADIAKAEKLLKLGLDTLRDVTNQNIYIRHHLKKYLRQYFGYFSSHGERIISINFLWNSLDNRSGQRWLKEAIDVSDGGNHYWRIKVDLDKSDLFDFIVNGEA